MEVSLELVSPGGDVKWSVVVSFEGSVEGACGPEAPALVDKAAVFFGLLLN
jgi:hypothetical protein